MKLTDWMREHQITCRAFAEKIGRSEIAVKRYRNGDRRPDRETIAKIAEVTNGEVTPNDFLLPNASQADAA